MNYPSIKSGDKVSFRIGLDWHKGIVVGVDMVGLIRVVIEGEKIDLGYQDNPQLMENGITNFRIHERADGTPVFMEGDVIQLKHLERKVLAVNGDTCLLSDSGDLTCASGWYTFEEAQADGWKLKEAPSALPMDDREFTMDDISRPFKEVMQEEKDRKEKLKEAPEEEKKRDGSDLPIATPSTEINLVRTYTKQEIVDVLKEVRDGYMSAWDAGEINTIEMIAKALNIALEEYE